MSVMLLFPRRSSVKPVNLDKDEMSVIRLSLRCSSVKLVKPESTLTSADTSFMPLLESPNVFRLVNPESGEISVILFLPSPNLLRLVNPESGEISVILLFPRRSLCQVGCELKPNQHRQWQLSLALKYLKVSNLLRADWTNWCQSQLLFNRSSGGSGSGMCTPSSATSLKVIVCPMLHGRCPNAV